MKFPRIFRKIICLVIAISMLFSQAPAYSMSPVKAARSEVRNEILKALLPLGVTSRVGERDISFSEFPSLDPNALPANRSELRLADPSKIRLGFATQEKKTTHSFASYNVGNLLNHPLKVLPDQALNEIRGFLQKAYDKKWLKGFKVVDVTASHINIHVSHNFGENNADVHRIMLEAVRAGLATMKRNLTVDPVALSAMELEKATMVTFADHSFLERPGVSESVEVAMGLNVDISAFNNTAYDLFASLDFNPAMTLSADKIRGVRFYIQKREDILRGIKKIKVLEISEGDNGEPDINQQRALKILLSQNENVVTAVYPVRGRAFKDASEPLMTLTFQPAFGTDGSPVLNPLAIFRGQNGGPPVGAVGHTVANTRLVLGGRDADHYVAVRPFSQEEARKPIKAEGIGGFVMYGYEQAGNGYMPRNRYIADYFALSKAVLHPYIKKARAFAKVMLAHRDFQPYLHPRAAAKKAKPVRHVLNQRFVSTAKDFEPDTYYADVERRVQSGELIKITSGKADYGANNGHTQTAALYTALQRAYLQVMKENGLIVDYYTLAQDPNNKLQRVRLEENYAAGDDTHLTVIGGKAEDVQLIIKRAMAVGPVFHVLAYKNTDQPDKPGVGTYGPFQDLQGSDKEAVEKDPFGFLGFHDPKFTERFFELANQLSDERDIKSGVVKSLYDQWKVWNALPENHQAHEIIRGSGNTSAQGIGVAYQYMDPKRDKGYGELDADKMGAQSKNVIWFHVMQKTKKKIAEIWDLKAFDEHGNIAAKDLPKHWSDISYLVLSAKKAKEKRITEADAEWLEKTAYQNGDLSTSSVESDYARLNDILIGIGFVPSKRIFMDADTELDSIRVLLGDSDRFNVKALWDKKQEGWDPDHVMDYLDRPVAISTVSRLGLLAGGEYVGKDDDKIMGTIEIMQIMFDYLETHPWMMQGDMNGSHQLEAMLLGVKDAIATLNSAPIAVGLINHFDENGRLVSVTDVFASKQFDKRRKAASEFNLDFILAQRATNPHLAHREQVEGAYAIEAISRKLDSPNSPYWLDKLQAAKPGEYSEPVSADAFSLYTVAAGDSAIAYQELLSHSEVRGGLAVDKSVFGVNSRHSPGDPSRQQYRRDTFANALADFQRGTVYKKGLAVAVKPTDREVIFGNLIKITKKSIVIQAGNNRKVTLQGEEVKYISPRRLPSSSGQTTRAPLRSEVRVVKPSATAQHSRPVDAKRLYRSEVRMTTAEARQLIVPKNNADMLESPFPIHAQYELAPKVQHPVLLSRVITAILVLQPGRDISHIEKIRLRDSADVARELAFTAHDIFVNPKERVEITFSPMWEKLGAHLAKELGDELSNIPGLDKKQISVRFNQNVFFTAEPNHHEGIVNAISAQENFHSSGLYQVILFNAYSAEGPAELSIVDVSPKRSEVRIKEHAQLRSGQPMEFAGHDVELLRVAGDKAYISLRYPAGAYPRTAGGADTGGTISESNVVDAAAGENLSSPSDTIKHPFARVISVDGNQVGLEAIPSEEFRSEVRSSKPTVLPFEEIVAETERLTAAHSRVKPFFFPTPGDAPGFSTRSFTTPGTYGNHGKSSVDHAAFVQHTVTLAAKFRGDSSVRSEVRFAPIQIPVLTPAQQIQAAGIFTSQPGAVSILGNEMLDFAPVAGTILNGTVIVVASSRAEVRALQALNAALPENKRLRIVPSLEAAVDLARSEARTQAAVLGLSHDVEIVAYVEDVLSITAERLKQILGKGNVKTILDSQFRKVLEVTGLASVVENFRAELRMLQSA